MRRSKIAVLAIAALGLASATAASSVGAIPERQQWRIALTTNREGDSEIYSMNPDGTSPAG